MKPENLPNHPVFLRLDNQGKEKLLKISELWEAPEGARLFFSGDIAEELVLLLEGRLESTASDGTSKYWFPGDLWGEDRLMHPAPLESTLVAVEDSRWISWPREILFNLLRSSTSIRKALSPLRDRNGRLLSGFSEVFLLTGSCKYSRRIRPSLRPACAGLLFGVLAAAMLWSVSFQTGILPPLSFLVAPAVYIGWLLMFLVKHFTREYGVEADFIRSRSFDWVHFTVESRRISLDMIQGLETEQNGLFRHILKTGTLIVKTSALDGELMFRDVNKPEALRDEILHLEKNALSSGKRREREELRKHLEKNGFGERVPVKIKGIDEGHRNGLPQSASVQFRKSYVVLAACLFLPMLVMLIPILGEPILSRLLSLPHHIMFFFALIPLLWALYRFEDWRNDIFQVSGGYAIDLYRKPLGLKESRQQVALTSVQNIRTEQKGIIQFMFRYGNVILVTAGGAADMVFLNVSKPWKVQETLFRYREKELKKQESFRREQQKEDFIRFTEALDQIRSSAERQLMPIIQSNEN